MSVLHSRVTLDTVTLATLAEMAVLEGALGERLRVVSRI